MRVSREEFLQKLRQVCPGLASKEIIEQSASFVFKEGKVHTFNDEVACTVKFQSEIEGAVHAKPLLELLDKIKDEYIEVAVGDDGLRIRTKNGRSLIRMEKEIHLPIDSIEDPQDWKDLNPEFVDGLEIVQSCASKDSTNYTMTCVHIHTDYVEACDDYQLARYPMKTGVEKSCMLKKDSLVSIIDLGVTEVSESPTWLHFRSPSGLVISCRRNEDEYNDLTSLLDVQGAKMTLPGGLAEAVNKAQVFTSDSAEDEVVEISIDATKLTIKGEGALGWYQERKSISYNGEPIRFIIAPKLLIEITKRTTDCILQEGRLKIDAGKFVFVACLGTRS